MLDRNRNFLLLFKGGTRYRARLAQRALNSFHWLRKNATATAAYLTLRLCGIELAYRSAVDRCYRRPHTAVNLDAVIDTDGVLELAKDELRWANERRVAVTSKCTILLMLTALFISSTVALLPQRLIFEPRWLQLLWFAAALPLLNAVVLLLTSCDVASERQVALTQADVTLDSTSLKKSLVHDYRAAKIDKDDHTDYLVDVYRAARFCFLLSVISISVLLLTYAARSVS